MHLPASGPHPYQPLLDVWSCLVPTPLRPLLSRTGWDDRREQILGCQVPEGGLHLMLTFLVHSGAAATVGTASALGAAPSRCPSPPWGPQVRAVGVG